MPARPDDREQQHGGCSRGENSERTEDCGRWRQVFVGDGRQAGEEQRR
ncbi:hypothetical protein ACIRU3_25005 [Streptomyces sp. NPDC101151]